VVILVVFLIVAIVISQLVGRMQVSLGAATSREREAQMYELSALWRSA
jgi:K+-sensing histidine kinase KdpD